MSISYDLTLAADVPAAELGQFAVDLGFDPAVVSTGPRGLVSVDLIASHGFEITIRSARSGYIEAVDDSGQNWEWEPPIYVAISFWPDKQVEDDVTDTMLPALAQVLAARGEDAAFTFNGDILLLTRLAGQPVKHNRVNFWDNHPVGDAVVPG